MHRFYIEVGLSFDASLHTARAIGELNIPGWGRYMVVAVIVPVNATANANLLSNAT